MISHLPASWFDPVKPVTNQGSECVVADKKLPFALKFSWYRQFPVITEYLLLWCLFS
jgi:hypothetical protein